MPLIKLSNLGYNYQGEMLRRSKLVKRWYNIVQTCEAFAMIRIIEDPDMVVESDGEARQLITIMSEDEAAMLEARNVQEPFGELLPAAAVDQYRPPASHSVTELWIKDQEELERLVKQYKSSFTGFARGS